MIAVYYLAAAWSVLLGFTAFCALPPDDVVPTVDFYHPCRIGIQRFHVVNDYVFATHAFNHHEEEPDEYLDLFPPHLDLSPPHLPLNNSTRLRWLNGMTSLVYYTHHDVIMHAVARLMGFMEFVDEAASTLTDEWTNRSIEAHNSLMQCSELLLLRIGPIHPPPNIVFGPQQNIVFTGPLSADPIIFGIFYEPCQMGVSGFYDVYNFVSQLNLGGVNPYFPDQNLDFPINFPMLPNTQHQNGELLWLNKMTSVILKNIAVIQSAVTRIRHFMLWLNLPITNSPIPGAMLNLPLPAAWRIRALESNSLLLTCSVSLLHLLELPLHVNVQVMAL